MEVSIWRKQNQCFLNPAHWVDKWLYLHSIKIKSQSKNQRCQVETEGRIWLCGHEFEQAPGVGDGQGLLACCSSKAFFSELTGLILQSKELSRVFSDTTVQKHQFVSTQLCLWSSSYIHTGLLENSSFD